MGSPNLSDAGTGWLCSSSTSLGLTVSQPETRENFPLLWGELQQPHWVYLDLHHLMKSGDPSRTEQLGAAPGYLGTRL